MSDLAVPLDGAETDGDPPLDVSVAGRNRRVMNASTLVLAFGAVLFVLPIPGTFVSGALVLLAGVIARQLGS